MYAILAIFIGVFTQLTGKLQNWSEISWFAWVFWFVLVVFVLWWLKESHHWKMVQFWWSVYTRHNWAELPHVLFPDLSLIWSIYIPVWLKYLHSSSVHKQKFSCRSLKISNNRKTGINLWFWEYSFFSENRKKLDSSATDLLEFFQDFSFLKIFRPHRYVNASYDWPILEQKIIGSWGLSTCVFASMQGCHAGWVVLGHGSPACLQIRMWTVPRSPCNSWESAAQLFLSRPRS